jgi:hypothetical protein
LSHRDPSGMFEEARCSENLAIHKCAASPKEAPWKTIAWKNCEPNSAASLESKPKFWNHEPLAPQTMATSWNTRSGKK